MIKSLPITLRILLWPLSWLPLMVVHFMGAALAMTLAAFSGKNRAFVRENVEQSGICKDPSVVTKLVRRNIAESGKSLLETFAIWQRPQSEVLAWVKEVEGWDQVKQAYAEGKGVIFLTPHLGCFEILARYIAARIPITILFRPHKKDWLMPLIEQGRTHDLAKLAPANMHGVRELLQALKRKETIGILPDQIPARGEGEWATFFGRQAYTMSLASRLAEKTEAALIAGYGERLPSGKGFRLHFMRLPEGSISTAEGLNRVIENMVIMQPEQYLWSYDRHKIKQKILKKNRPVTPAP